MPSDVVNALSLVQLCLHIVVVCAVFEQEFHVVEIAVVVRKFLGQVEAVSVHMAIVGEGVVILRVGPLPSQGHTIGVARIAIGHGGIAVYSAGVGDPHGQVAVAPEQTGGGIIDGSGRIDLIEAVRSHGNGHAAPGFRAVICVIGSELAILLVPNRHSIRAGSILEELDLHIIFVVLDALG